ncbi:DNA gyrase subunit A, partial [Escherichia coli]
RKTHFDKEKFSSKLHILEGLTIALDKMDFTISLIRKSKTKVEAKECLKQELSIDDIQADAILQMQLQRLTNLEKDSIYKQVEKLNDDIKFLN